MHNMVVEDNLGFDSSNARISFVCELLVASETYLWSLCTIELERLIFKNRNK